MATLIGLLASLQANAANPQRFPGASAAPFSTDDPTRLLHILFGVPSSAPITFAATELCNAVACAVRLADETAWADADGTAHMLLVTAAEPPNASHATPALLGIALLRKEHGGWTLEAGSPAVDEVGAYGTVPDVSTTIAGKFGRGVVLTSSDIGQGVASESWRLYLPVAGRFAEALQVSVGQDSSAICAASDAACWQIADPRNARAPDFRSRMKVSPSADGGIDVLQVVLSDSPTSRVTSTQRWHIDLAGVAHQRVTSEAATGGPPDRGSAQ